MVAGIETRVNEMPTLARVNLPSELVKALRDATRESEGDIVADAPLNMLIRYWIARTAGGSHKRKPSVIFSF